MDAPPIPATWTGATLRALLAGAIDYAGLFPPAALDLKTVVANYAEYRRSADAWALGRLVVPAARLPELSDNAERYWRDAIADPWRISALVGKDVDGDAGHIARFNDAQRGALVDSVDAVASDASAIRRLARRFVTMLTFLELPLDGELHRLLQVVGEERACAKVRTGGVVPEAIPDAPSVAHFLRACADAAVSFKATAGLHHPLRGEYPLTYAPESARGTMFGYVNVFVAAVRARAGADEADLTRVLESRHLAELATESRDAGDILSSVSVRAVAETRTTFALSFGSCSFREPLDDLASILQR